MAYITRDKLCTLLAAAVRGGFTKGESHSRPLTRLTRERPVQLRREQVDEP